MSAKNNYHIHWLIFLYKEAILPPFSSVSFFFPSLNKKNQHNDNYPSGGTKRTTMTIGLKDHSNKRTTIQGP